MNITRTSTPENGGAVSVSLEKSEGILLADFLRYMEHTSTDNEALAHARFCREFAEGIEQALDLPALSLVKKPKGRKAVGK